MIRQGDVLLRKVESIPADQAPHQTGKTVLAFGEVTGHHHRFEDPRVTAFWKEDGGEAIAGGSAIVNLPEAFVGTPTQVEYVEVPDGGADLVHEEHSALRVEAGKYQVVRQREYVAPEVVRQVVD